MAQATSMNILSIITNEHRRLEQLIVQAGKASKNDIYNYFNQIYELLNLHTAAEELVFYSAMREYEETRQYVTKSEGEHQEAKVILEEIQELKPTDPLFQSKMGELRTVIRHHVEKEENEIFNAVRQCMNDKQLVQLGQEFQAAQARLESDVKDAMIT